MTAPSDALRKIMFRRFIAEYEVRTGQTLSQGKLAEMLGVKQAQVSQYLGPERKIPQRRWEVIVQSLGGENEPTAEDYAELNRQIESKSLHHGQKLRAFLQREGIMKKDAAEQLKVSRAAVSNFFNTEQFRPELLQKLKEGVGFSLSAPHTPRNAVFLHSNQKDLSDFTDLPLFDLTQLGAGFDPARTIVVQVESDDLTPMIRPNTRVLAARIERADYKYAKGLMVLHFRGQLALGEITANDLLDKNYLTLLQYKGSLQVLESDIQNLYRIVMSIMTY